MTALGIGEALEIDVIIGEFRALQDRVTPPVVGGISVQVSGEDKRPFVLIAEEIENND